MVRNHKQFIYPKIQTNYSKYHNLFIKTITHSSNPYKKNRPVQKKNTIHFKKKPSFPINKNNKKDFIKNFQLLINFFGALFAKIKFNPY